MNKERLKFLQKLTDEESRKLADVALFGFVTISQLSTEVLRILAIGPPAPWTTTEDVQAVQEEREEHGRGKKK